MGEYLIKSALAITFAYFLYLLFMRKGTNFRWHRMYLTGVMFIALALPAVVYVLPVHQKVVVHIPKEYIPDEYIPVFVPQAVSPQDVGPIEHVAATELVSSPSEHQSAFTFRQVIGSLYFIGLFLVIAWKFFGFLQLAKLVFRHGVCRRGNRRFVFIKNLQSPFSFFRLIFIDPQQFQSESYNVLLEHETVHVRQWHSLDLILLEALSAIQWFNPVVWHLRRTLTEVHEFLADQYTISEKCPPQEYKRILLSMVCGFDVRLPVHGMSNSLTKKRIQMITNNKQNKKWFIILVFLIMAIIATATFSSVVFARDSTISPEKSKVVKNGIVTGTIFPQNDVVESVPGWFKAGSKPNSYKVGIDKTIFKSGGSSAFIASTEAMIDGFGTLMQSCGAQDYLGKRVRMTAYIKSENVTNWAGMWMRVDSKSARNMLSFDNMQDRPIKGTKDWTKCEIVLDVPEESRTLNFGVLLDGTGKVWFDDISFEVVDKQVKTTGIYGNTSLPTNFPKKPANIDFEK
jgi:hypothetical protein